jgi:hypothetical protein
MKSWFRFERRKEPQENHDEEETEKVDVIVYLEDPGGHTPKLRTPPVRI